MTTLWVFIASTLRGATPLLLAALGGITSERSGVVNIALEGIMLMGAWAAVYFSVISGSAWVGMVGAIVVGMLIASLHAIASIRFKANQVVSGTAINLLAAGFTEYAYTAWQGISWDRAVMMPEIGFGEYKVTIFVLFAAILVVGLWFALYKTPWGLRLRAAGEHPLALDTVGVKVEPMRYQGVLLSGVFAGLGGAALSIGLLSRFTLGMSSGYGFIALAAMIFGRWDPIGSIFACLLFGAANALSTLLQLWGVPIPSMLVLMAPYILTILALAGLVGRSVAPKALGVPYTKGGK
jgi:ABC-type uncharacterized transport system permease subunit